MNTSIFPEQAPAFMILTQRLFIAVPVPDNLKLFFQEQLLHYTSHAIRLVPWDNLHLTVHFLGETPADNLESIVTILQTVAARTEAFTLHLECLEPGPKPNSPRLIWARFAAHPAFTALCTAITTQLGVKPGSQDYIPHITLARFRKDVAKPTALPIKNLKNQQISLPVNSLALWQSELKSPHPEYRILVRHPLAP
ncbi:RNA 2',3'-cyclic phosphodiesterase [Adhaeribacter pallidiroseus]|uniref:RNA 2',3'-cyclic phosphodiesterase n=1 Tax=Adhaeribacter pallidiroseus TaxID=2072847 RepID=A0A369QRM1_9BACT|nr:RNA 2',3'-cyclic phosphodiesterase [Adhaeribacter pallidiroseus]RDC64838.1 hypothetical protein AHMF7616_03459 [Adhaeribacter pallidiroseus]